MLCRVKSHWADRVHETASNLLSVFVTRSFKLGCAMSHKTRLSEVAWAADRTAHFSSVQEPRSSIANSQARSRMEDLHEMVRPLNEVLKEVPKQVPKSYRNAAAQAKDVRSEAQSPSRMKTQKVSSTGQRMRKRQYQVHLNLSVYNHMVISRDCSLNEQYV